MTFNGNELRLARQYHGFSLNELAAAIDVSRQYIHQLETGRCSDPTYQNIELLANELKVLPEFFYTSGQGYLTEEQFHFRKNITSKVASKQTMKARGEFFERLVKYLDEKLNLPPVDFPDCNEKISTNEDIEKVAEKMRNHWNLETGPISNMVRVVENAGAVVTYFAGVSTEVDALSITAKRPVIVRNDSKQSPFRLRFDLAHEIAHLIMHEGQVTGDRETESQANRFASAFLMPRTTFAKDFLAFGFRGSRFNWQGISDIKLKWKVNKAAILYRAKDLGLVDANQYRSGIIYLRKNAEGLKESEDDFIEKEKYELLNNALSGLEKYCQIKFNDFSNFHKVTPDFLSIILDTSKNKLQLKLVQ